MNDRDKDRIECAIRHIESSLDVDPWACEIAVEAMKKQLPSAQPEITQKDVELYCRQRCLSVITNELFNEMKARLAQPEIVRCKECAKREYCRTSTVWAVAPDDDWFCADAERRTDE